MYLENQAEVCSSDQAFSFSTKHKKQICYRKIAFDE